MDGRRSRRDGRRRRRSRPRTVRPRYFSSTTSLMIWPCSPPVDAGAFAACSCRRGRGADEHGVVPGQLRDRLGQLLQPAVVGEAAVEDRRIGAERRSRDRRRLPLRMWRHCGLRHRQRIGRRRDAFGANAVSGITPSCSQRRHAVEVVASSHLPVLADDVVGRPLRAIAHRRQHFVRRLAAVERRDERLDDRRPCRRSRARRSTTRGSAPPESASGTAPTSRRRRDRGARGAAPCPARRRTRDRPAPCRPDCRRG